MSAKDKAGATTGSGSIGVDGPSDAAQADGPIKIDSAAQAMIGQQLKAMYSDFVQQEIPDHLLRLLDELASKELKE